MPMESGPIPILPLALAQVLLDTVAEKTGYPAEMLELDMRLDADLGIDSIKRVEIFSALQERYPGLPPAGPERIGTLETLRDIVAFLGETEARRDSERNSEGQAAEGGVDGVSGRR